MANKKSPCKECISFAICYNINPIRCEILYHFLCKTRTDPHASRPLYDGQKSINVKTTEKLFNRTLSGTKIEDNQIAWEGADHERYKVSM